MNKIIGIIALVLGILLVGAYLASSSAPSVTAQGSSVIKVTPDLVTVNVLIETKGADAQIAQDKNSQIRDAVISDLKKLGYTDADIKLGYYNIGPDYEWTTDKQTLKGYVARQEIIVKTKDFTKVSQIVDSVIDSGALVSYINFEISDSKQSEFKAQALQQASADAKAKAQSTAAGLNKKLGRLVSVQNQDFHYPGPMVKYAMEDSSSGGGVAQARDAAANLSPQDIEVTASVVVEYKLRWF